MCRCMLNIFCYRIKLVYRLPLPYLPCDIPYSGYNLRGAISANHQISHPVVIFTIVKFANHSMVFMARIIYAPAAYWRLQHMSWNLKWIYSQLNQLLEDTIKFYKEVCMVKCNSRSAGLLL